MGADKMEGERIAIHASRQIDESVYARIYELAPELNGTYGIAPWSKLSRVTSAIIGVATIDKVLHGGWDEETIARHRDLISFSNGEFLGPSQVRWFFGPVGILLRDVRAIEPIANVKGALGFWRLSNELAREVAARVGKEVL